MRSMAGALDSLVYRHAPSFAAICALWNVYHNASADVRVTSNKVRCVRASVLASVFRV